MSQNPPTRMAAVQWMNIGRLAGSSVILEKLVGLFDRGRAVNDRDVEVLQPGLLDRLPLFVRAMLTRRPQVQDRLDAFGLEPREVVGPRLSARAEVGRDTHEVPDGCRVGRLWRRRRLGSLQRHDEQQ